MGCISCKGKTIISYNKENISPESNKGKNSNENNFKYIKCFSYKNEEDDNLNISLEKIMEKDFNNQKLDLLPTFNSLKISKFQNELSDEEVENIKKSLLNHYLFRDMNDMLLSNLIINLVLITVEPNHILFSEGEIGNYFYIVKEGELNLKIANSENTKIFKNGDTFGEYALMEKGNRSGTVTSLKHSQLYCLAGELFRELVKKVNSTNLNEKLNLIKYVNIFKGLPNQIINNLAEKMFKCEFDDNENIITADKNRESLFIIKKGSVILYNYENVEIKKYIHKDYFGVITFVFNWKRNFKVISIGNTECYQISSKIFKEVIGENYKKEILFNICKNYFLNYKILKNFVIGNYFEQIFEKFKTYCCYDEEYVFTNNPLDKKIIIVFHGFLKRSDNDLILAKRGEIYCDNNITSSNNDDCDLKMSRNSISLIAKWDDVLSVFNFEKEESEAINILLKISILRKIYIFSYLSESSLLKIIKKMNMREIEENKIILEKGSIVDNLYIIFKGNAKVVNENYVLLYTLKEGDFFGDKSIFLNYKQKETIISEKKSLILTISKNYLYKVLEDHMIKYFINKLKLEDKSNTLLENLYFIRKIGFGKFSDVYLVHNRKNLYALKKINKNIVREDNKLMKYFINEKNILNCINNPFIVKLVQTFKTNEDIFFLMEYIQGYSFSFYLNNRISSNLKCEYEVQFYVSCLIIAINYLNSNKIIHRDIKPDNIIIDEKGYIKLVDFGASTYIKNFTNTLIGTPHYTAPEMLTGLGYSYSVDYWSLGVTAYEIYYNEYPFGNNTNEPMLIYEDILKKKVSFPDNNKVITNFLKLLLKKKPIKRVCNINELKSTELLKTFDFNSLIEYSVIPPCQPNIFDNYFINEYNDKLIDKFNEYKINECTNEILDYSWEKDF